jgi:hypothetical protein
MNGVAVTVFQRHIAGTDRQLVCCSATALLYFCVEGFPLSAAFDTPQLNSVLFRGPVADSPACDEAAISDYT